MQDINLTHPQRGQDKIWLVKTSPVILFLGDFWPTDQNKSKRRCKNPRAEESDALHMQRSSMRTRAEAGAQEIKHKQIIVECEHRVWSESITKSESEMIKSCC